MASPNTQASQKWIADKKTVRSLRKLEGLSQARAAKHDKWNVSVRTIRKMETGVPVAMRTLTRVAEKNGLAQWYELLTVGERRRLFASTSPRRARTPETAAAPKPRRRPRSTAQGDVFEFVDGQLRQVSYLKLGRPLDVTNGVPDRFWTVRAEKFYMAPPSDLESIIHGIVTAKEGRTRNASDFRRRIRRERLLAAIHTALKKPQKNIPYSYAF